MDAMEAEAPRGGAQAVHVVARKRKTHLRAVAEDRTEQVDHDHRGFDLTGHLVARLAALELIAVENCAELVSLMPDIAGRIETARRAARKARHVEMLANLDRHACLTQTAEVVEGPWRRIRAFFSSAARNCELAACVMMQDLMIETILQVAYRGLQRSAERRPRRVADIILGHRSRLLGGSLTRVRMLFEQDPAGALETAVGAHHGVMPPLFEIVSVLDKTAQARAADRGREADTLHAQIDALRIDALDAYTETLDAAGFDHKVTLPLVASLFGYGPQPPVSRNLRRDGEQWRSADLGVCEESGLS